MTLFDVIVDKQKWSGDFKAKMKAFLKKVKAEQHWTTGNFEGFMALVNWVIEEKEEEMRETVRDWACRNCECKLPLEKEWM